MAGLTLAAFLFLSANAVAASIPPIGRDQPVAPVTYTVAPPALQLVKGATNGDSVFAIWYSPMFATPSAALLGGRVGSDGTVLDVPSRVIAPAPWENADVAWIGGHYLVVLDVKDAGIFARSFAADGTPLDSGPRLIAAGSAPRLVSDGIHGVLTYLRGATDYVQPIDADGDPIGNVMTSVALPTGVVAAAVNSKGVLVGWQRGSPDPADFVTFCPWDGTAVTTTRVDLVNASVYTFSLTAGGDEFLMAGHGQARLLSGNGTPIGDPFTIPSVFGPCVAWNGASWTIAAGDAYRLLLGRVGSDGHLDATQTLTTGEPIMQLLWNGRQFFLLASDAAAGVKAILFDGAGTLPADPAARGAIPIPRAASEQIGGAMASTPVRTLTVWNERTGLTSFAVRGAFIDSGRIAPPFDIASNAIGVAPAVATDGNDFVVAWSTTSGVFSRTVSEQQSLGSTVQLDSTSAANLTAAWSGSAYVVAWGGTTVRVAAVSPSGGIVAAAAAVSKTFQTPTLTLACDSLECVLVIRDELPPPMFSPLGNEVEVTAVRIAAEGTALNPDIELQFDPLDSPGAVAMRIGGASLVVLGPQNGDTLSAVLLDAPFLVRPLATHPNRVQPVSAERDGVWWIDLTDDGQAFLHWSRIEMPLAANTIDFDEAMPLPFAASSSGRTAYVTYAAGESDPSLLAPRIFVRTYAAPAAQPRRRAVR